MLFFDSALGAAAEGVAERRHYRVQDQVATSREGNSADSVHRWEQKALRFHRYSTPSNIYIYY